MIRATEFTSLNELRLNNQLCDGVLRTSDGEIFPIHRVVLSVFSPYFRAYFTNSLNNGQPELSEMIIPDISSYIVKMLIHFAYTQTCQVTHENVFCLMIAADKLSCDSLVKFCSDFVSASISAANCINIFKFSKTYFFKDLKAKAWQCVCELIEQTLSTVDFKNLSCDELHELLSADQLNIKREETVFEAIKIWVLADPKERYHAIARLLPCVRFGSISPNYYCSVIKRFPYYTEESQDFLQTVDYLFDKSEDSYFYRYCNFQPRVPDEVVFAFGGWCEGKPTDAIETYDKRSDSWYLSSLRDQKIRAYHGVVVLDNLIYVIGGFDGIEYFSTMHCLDPVTYTWTEKACLHENRCYISVCLFGNEIYAMGGYNGRTRMNSAEKYNPILNQWTMIASMNVVRSDANAASLGNFVYVAGGFNGVHVLHSVERYSPATNHWDYIDSMSTPRSGLGLITHNNFLYALGGFDGVNRLKSVERCNPNYNRWDIVADMQCCRSNMASVIMDNSIYVIGGFNGDTSSGNSTIRFTEVYDEGQNTWFDKSPMNLNRSALSACVCRRLPNAKTYTYSGIVPGPVHG